MRAPAARKDADLDPVFEYFRADKLPTEEGYIGDPGVGPQDIDPTSPEYAAERFRPHLLNHEETASTCRESAARARAGSRAHHVGTRHPRFPHRQAQGRRAIRRDRRIGAAEEPRDRRRAGGVPPAVRRHEARRDAGGSAQRRAVGHADARGLRAAPRRFGARGHRHRTQRHPAASVRRARRSRSPSGSWISASTTKWWSAACVTAWIAWSPIPACTSNSTTTWSTPRYFPVDGIRQAPVSPVDGKPMRRIDADELEVLLDAEDAPRAQ